MLAGNWATEPLKKLKEKSLQVIRGKKETDADSSFMLPLLIKTLCVSPRKEK